MHTPPPACPGPLQDIFPDSFTQLVRVYNHKAVDKLLSQHEAAASHRDRCVTALAAARGKADAAQGKGGAAKAAARLERAEAELAKAEERVGELEGQVEVARQAALEQPLGTAFIALFRCGSLAAASTWGGAAGRHRVQGACTKGSAGFGSLADGSEASPRQSRPTAPLCVCPAATRRLLRWRRLSRPASCPPSTSMCAPARGQTTSTGWRCGRPGARHVDVPGALGGHMLGCPTAVPACLVPAADPLPIPSDPMARLTRLPALRACCSACCGPCMSSPFWCWSLSSPSEC